MDSNYIESIISDWDKLCRICLTDQSILFPVIKLDAFDEQYKMSFCEILKICSGLKVSSSDHLPQLICSLCIANMHTVLEFRKKCQASENMLTTILHKKEELINVTHCASREITDTDAGLDHEEDDESKNIVVTDFLKMDFSISDKGQSDTTALKESSDKKVYYCPICVTPYSTYRRLATHKKTHTNSCWKCNISLKNEEEYHKHLKLHDKNVNDKYLCTTCGQSLSSLSALHAHRRIHVEDKRYECSYCGKMFLHWSSRRIHVRNTHTKEKPHACTTCDNRYQDKTHLKRHMRTHTGEKPYQCTLCDMKFAQKSTLTMHMFKHTGEKRIYCQVCGKGFTRNSALKTHMVTHTGERNHVCMVCGKAFTQAHVLRSHMKQHPEVEKSTEEIRVKSESD